MSLRKWTLEQRLQQAQKIQELKPWQYSTGPKTPEGKAKSRKNSYKHGTRCKEVRDLARQLTEWKKNLTQLIEFI